MNAFMSAIVVGCAALAIVTATPGILPLAGQRGGMSMHRGMMEFEQVDVSVEDTADGVAMTFTTESGDLEQLRQRVRYMADMLNMQPATRPPQAGRGGMMGAMMLSARASFEDATNGARLMLQPRDEDGLDDLRGRVRLLADRLEASGSMTMAGMMMAGPMQLDGAVVAVSDVPEGVALTFTTGFGDVEQLQLRVENMAARFDAQDAAAAPPRRGRGAMGRGMMFEATATVERLPDGARLTLEPADPSQLPALRARAGRMVEMMTSASVR